MFDVVISKACAKTIFHSKNLLKFSILIAHLHHQRSRTPTSSFAASFAASLAASRKNWAFLPRQHPQTPQNGHSPHLSPTNQPFLPRQHTYHSAEPEPELEPEPEHKPHPDLNPVPTTPKPGPNLVPTTPKPEPGPNPAPTRPQPGPNA